MALPKTVISSVMSPYCEVKRPLRLQDVGDNQYNQCHHFGNCCKGHIRFGSISEFRNAKFHILCAQPSIVGEHCVGAYMQYCFSCSIVPLQFTPPHYDMPWHEEGWDDTGSFAIKKTCLAKLNLSESALI